MTVKEAAATLGCSTSMIRKLMDNGELAYVQIGRRRLPLREDVAEYKRRHTHKEVKLPKLKEPFVYRHLFQKR